MALFDLSELSFDEFVSFFFDHDVVTEEYWYQDPELSNWNDFDDEDVASSKVIVQHMTRLFAEFSQVASRFSLPQVNSAIWAMFTFGPFRLQKHLWLPAVSISPRLECIRSMYTVYAEFVSKSTVEVMENCFNMWWHQIASSFWEQIQFDSGIAEGDWASLDEEHRTLLNAMFETLSRILDLPDARTQMFALHGLGHLHHPGVRELVQGYIDKYRAEFSPEGVKWAEQCRDGTVM